MTRSRGSRGGRNSKRTRDTQDIHSKVRGVRRLSNTSHVATGAIADRAKYFGIAEIDETEDTHVIPRRSVTVSQFLQVKRPEIETETRRARQLDKKDAGKFTSVDEALAHGKLIQTTDERAVWRSDRTLLITGRPGASLPTVTREGFVKQGLNRRNTRVTENEERNNAEKILQDLGPAVDAIDTDE